MKFLSNLLICLVLLSAKLHSADLLTLCEKSNFKETPRYIETIEYCKLLEKQSDFLKLSSFGISPQGRELPILIYDKNMNFTPDAVRKSNNAVLFIQACIHPGESEGKDAEAEDLLMQIEHSKSYLKNTNFDIQDLIEETKYVNSISE